MLVWRALTLSGFIFMKKAWQGQYQVSWGGLPGVLADKGTLVKYRKERGNMILFLGNRGTRLYKLEDENMVNTFIKRGSNKENVWEYGSIGQFWKGTRTPCESPLRAPLICQKWLEGSVKLQIQRGIYTSGKTTFYYQRIEWLKYCFRHEEMKLLYSSRLVMFFLLHRLKDIDKIQYKFGREITEITSSINSRVRLWKINHSDPGCSFYEFYEGYICQ